MVKVADKSALPAYQAGGFALLLALAAILSALAAEHLFGILPCPLCLQQRYAYYLGIPLLFGGLALAAGLSFRASAALFAVAALAFLANAGLGAYHAGVEWKLWLGPDTCANPPGDLKPLGRALLGELERARVIRCDEAAWRFLGLSFAGWNVVGSIAIAASAFVATRAALDATQPARV